MKRLQQEIVFYILKIVEVAAVVFAPYWVGNALFYATGMPLCPVFWVWGIGMFSLSIVLGLVALAVLIVPEWIKLNRKWAKRITGGRD